MNTSHPPPEWDFLLSAAQKNNPNEIHRLVNEEGVIPNHCNAVGQSALHIAALWGNVEALQALLSHNKTNVALSAPNRITGATPLHCAVQSTKQRSLSNRVECVRLLLEAGADPSIPDLYGHVPDDYCHDDSEIKKLLCDAMPKVELFGFISKADVDAVRDILERNGESDSVVNRNDKDGNTPLLHAIEILIDGNDKDDDDSTSDEQIAEIIKLLLDSDQIDPNVTNEEGISPLHKLCTALSRFFFSTTTTTNEFDAKIKNMKQIITLLVQSDQITIPNETIFLLHDASRRNNLRMMSFLLNDVGIDVNSKGRQGFRPLHFAARSGNVEAVKLLLEAGANVSVVDDRGKTPLDAAVVNDREEVIEVLKKAMMGDGRINEKSSD